MVYIGLILLACPTVLAWVGNFLDSFWVIGFSVVAQFLVILFCPFFRHRENLWLFISVFLSSFPYCIYIMSILDLFVLDYYNGLLRTAVYCELYIIFLAVSEVFFCCIMRLFRKKQYALNFFDEQ